MRYETAHEALARGQKRVRHAGILPHGEFERSSQNLLQIREDENTQTLGWGIPPPRRHVFVKAS